MIEKEIEAAALAQIAAMFQRPSQLERLDELKKRADRKKAAVDSMLRASVQSQLEGIRSAVSHLHTASEDVRQIEDGMQNIVTMLKPFPETKIKLSKLSQANLVHGQYATAIDNLMHIFNLRETIEKTNEFIMEGKLLHAHKNIMELENARDDLMFEVHKLSSEKQDYDKNLLKNYFVEVERLANDLCKQIFYVCSRAIEVVQSQDNALQQLVSAIRIIEREERIDQYYLENESAMNGFVALGRPRKWRQKLFEVLEKNVHDRLQGHQLENRAINSLWLARYLEAVRRKFVDDLKIVKNCLTASFPPEYCIYDRYIKHYHEGISILLREIASETLEKNELVQLLGWIRAYPGDTMLGTPQLKIQANELVQENPLLPKSLTNQLCAQYVELTRRNLNDWLDNTLTREKDDWYKNEEPEYDVNDCSYTSLPSLLFGILDDTVLLSKEISQEIIPLVIEVAVDVFYEFSVKYKDAATAFKRKHFDDRSYFQKFTATIIAMANNLDICVENTDKIEKHIRLTMETVDTDTNRLSYSARSIGLGHVNRQELIDKIETLKNKWTAGIQFAITSLLEELFQDINKHSEKLMTRTWLMGSIDLETICATVADYYNDYRRLRSHIRHLLIKEIFYKVIGEYLIAVDSKRMTFSKYEERHLAAERIKTDAQRIETTFKPLFDNGDYAKPIIASVLPALADVIDLRDKTLLTLEASTFVRKYPDVPVEFLTSIIQLREDTSKTEAKSIAEEAVNHARFHPKGDQELLKLFQMCCKSGSARRALPALDTTVQNMLATLKATVPK